MRIARLGLLGAVLLSLGLASSARADWDSTISAANPLHWFQFADEGTTADDVGSANVDGTYVGAVGLGTPGLVGAAASFDGASHVLVGGPDLPTPWTLETIFLADPVNGGVSQGIVGTDFTAAYRMAVKAEQYNATERLGYTVFGVADVTFADAPTPTDFAHVVFVGTDAGVELFVNGAAAGMDATATPLARYAFATGAVRADGTLVDGLTGTLDEIVIYDRALSAGDVAAHYAAIPEPMSASLILIGGLSLLAFRRK